MPLAEEFQPLIHFISLCLKSFPTFAPMKNYWTFIICCILIWSCETDVDVNDDWKDITVTFGVLSKNDSTHYIKINKAFLGKADAYVMAQISDSSQYQNISATIEEIKNGTTQRSWSLKDTLITDKEEGTFYYPEQTVYYFYADNLDGDASYQLTISIPGKEETVSANTELIDNFALLGGFIFQSPVDIGFYNKGTVEYTDPVFEWGAQKDGKRYQPTLVFKYVEMYLDTTADTLTFEWYMPPQKAGNILGVGSMEQEIKGEEFYQQIAANIKPIAESPNVKWRKFIDLRMYLTIAADELNTYIEVNEPATGLIQEKPEYTNIENGIGIFSSRIKVYSKFNKEMNSDSDNELYSGKYTSDLGFCDPNPNHDYFCGN